MPTILIVIQLVVIGLAIAIVLYAYRRHRIRDSAPEVPAMSTAENVAMSAVPSGESEEEQLRKAIAVSIEEEAERKMIERALAEAKSH